VAIKEVLESGLFLMVGTVDGRSGRVETWSRNRKEGGKYYKIFGIKRKRILTRPSRSNNCL
jgi:hypothetical protein